MSRILPGVDEEEEHDDKKDKDVKLLCMGQIVARSEYEAYREGL